jgi:hypothetical protein
MHAIRDGWKHADIGVLVNEHLVMRTVPGHYSGNGSRRNFNKCSKPKKLKFIHEVDSVRPLAVMKGHTTLHPTLSYSRASIRLPLAGLKKAGMAEAQ